MILRFYDFPILNRQALNIHKIITFNGGRFPGFETAFSITSTDHSKSNINIQLLIHTYS